MPERIVFGDKSDGRRIATIADTAYDETRDIVISHVRDGHLTGGVLYTAFTNASCLMHVAGLRRPWGSRDFLWVAFDYPFVQCGLERVFAVVPESNVHSLRFVRKLGFHYVSQIPDRYVGRYSDLVMAMEWRECRWIWLTPRRITRGY